MIGRASIGNPWLFNQVKEYIKTRKHIENLGFYRYHDQGKTLRNGCKLER